MSEKVQKTANEADTRQEVRQRKADQTKQQNWVNAWNKKDTSSDAIGTDDTAGLTSLSSSPYQTREGKSEPIQAKQSPVPRKHLMKPPIQAKQKKVLKKHQPIKRKQKNKVQQGNNPITHPIVEGDTLYDITLTYFPQLAGKLEFLNAKMQEIADLNNLGGIEGLLLPGKTLNIPTQVRQQPQASQYQVIQHTVKPNDSFWAITEKYFPNLLKQQGLADFKAKMQEIAELNGLYSYESNIDPSSFSGKPLLVPLGPAKANKQQNKKGTTAQKSKTRIIFVNGKIGGGSPPAGAEYWNGEGFDSKKDPESSFVLGAKAYFNTNDAIYTAEDYGYFSSADGRKEDGIAYAKKNLATITQNLNKKKDKFAFVNHSMGGAFAEGIVEHLHNEGWTIEKIVHVDVFQAANIKTIDPNSNRIITIDYQLTDDWVIQNPMWSKPGDVQGADYKVREEGGENWKTNHTSPMWKQGRQFWEKMDTKILKLSPQDIVPDDKTKA